MRAELARSLCHRLCHGLSLRTCQTFDSLLNQTCQAFKSLYHVLESFKACGQLSRLWTFGAFEGFSDLQHGS